MTETLDIVFPSRILYAMLYAGVISEFRGVSLDGAAPASSARVTPPENMAL
jgi:hypothetical protein